MMASFRLNSIAELARQMAFTPHATLAVQLTSAEQLVLELEPHKAYPREFVVFRITGYRPKTVRETDLLTGMALQHDLGLLIERLSETLAVSVSLINEPVLSIDEVAERLNVTAKTIQRWRRRGLPARRFVFADGKARVGFFVSSVERFFARHRDQIPEQVNWSVLSEEETAQILRYARRLGDRWGSAPEPIAARIAARLNRSRLTIFHTIRKENALADARTLTEEQHSKVARLFRHGATLRQIANAMRLPRMLVYRAVMDDRLARLARRKAKFIDDPLYHQPDAVAAIDAIVRTADESLEPAEALRVPRDLPIYLQEIYRTPLLSAAQERAMFLKLNFRKYQFSLARRKLDVAIATRKDADRLALKHRKFGIAEI